MYLKPSDHAQNIQFVIRNLKTIPQSFFQIVPKSSFFLLLPLKGVLKHGRNVSSQDNRQLRTMMPVKKDYTMKVKIICHLKLLARKIYENVSQLFSILLGFDTKHHLVCHLIFINDLIIWRRHNRSNL